MAFIEDARKRFQAESAYLDDRANVPMRFRTAANLTQIIWRKQDQVEPSAVVAELNDRIRQLFSGQTLELVPFAATPADVPDDVGNGSPYLVLLHADAATLHPDQPRVPRLVENMYRHKNEGATDFRLLLNNLCFLVADETTTGDMAKAVARRLALAELQKPDNIGGLASHQQDQVRQLYRDSDMRIAVNIQQTYRHLFYPSNKRLEGALVELNRIVIDKELASCTPGQGQLQVVRALREAKKLRVDEDQPDSPAYVRDRTPLKKGQITTASLRDEFRRDPALPTLKGDDVFRKGITNGIEQGEYVYVSGDLLVGQGDPLAVIKIDESSFIYTAEYARSHGIWPRKPKVEPVPPEKEKVGGGGGGGGGGGDGPKKDPPAPPVDDGGAPTDLSVEAPLAQALSQIWSLARSKQIAAIGKLRLRVFNATDAFKMLGAVSTVTGPKKTVTLDIKYEKAAASTFDGIFAGTVEDAKVVKEFLEPQVRAAKDRAVQGTFDLAFESGLLVAGEAPEKLAAQLARFVTGKAHVQAFVLAPAPGAKS